MISLRTATAADLALLSNWDEQPHVNAADPDSDWNWAFELTRRPPWREQLIAELNGRPVGFVQIIDPAQEDSHYWGSIASGYRAIDIWIGDEKDLGHGYGEAMMLQALDRCFAEPSVTGVLIDPLASNTRARRFYERLGFNYVEARKFDEDDCSVYRFNRSEWDARRQRSR